MAEPSLMRRVLGGTLNYGLGQFLPQLLGFALLPLYAAFLTPEDYGLIELCTVVSSSLAILMRVGLPGSVSRFYFDHAEGPELRSYITTLSRVLAVSSVGVAGLALLVGRWALPAALPELPYWPYFSIAVGSAVLVGNSELQRRLIQVREQSSYAARLNVALAVVNAAVVVPAVVYFRAGALGVVGGQLVVTVLFWVQARSYLRPELRGTFQLGLVRGSLQYALGILPSHLVGVVSTLGLRVVLTSYASLEAVGLFALAAKVASPLNLAVTAFNTAFAPVYFAARKHKSEAGVGEMGALQQRLGRLALFVALGAVTCGPPVVELITPPRFHPAAPLVPIFVVGFVAQVVQALVSAELFYSKQTWKASLCAAANAGVLVTTTMLLVPRLGAAGAAWAQVAGMAAGAGLAAFFSARSPGSLARLQVPWFPTGLAAGLACLVMAFPLPSAWASLAVGASAVTLFFLFAVKDALFGGEGALLGRLLRR